MKVAFDLTKVKTVEFGMGQDSGDEQVFFAVPVDPDAQKALVEMVKVTMQAMQNSGDNQIEYQPSEKYASVEWLFLPLSGNSTSSIQQLHNAANLLLNSNAISKMEEVFCYFARLTDSSGHRLTAMRRAAQFKGILKSRLLRLVTDSLKLVHDNVFKLDIDFDFLIDSANVHILRPSGFEAIAKLQEEILAAVPKNIASIRRSLSFVDLGGVEDYASKHLRAARYLASIQGQGYTKNINKGALKKLCKATGVLISEFNGKLLIDAGHELGFLEVLDRRRYELELVDGSPESFMAASRRKLNG